MIRPERRSKRTLALQPIAGALANFFGKRDGDAHTQLTRLWEHWSMVLGPDLAALAVPLGHKKDVLMVAAEDSMAAQDMAMQADEVLLRVNAFMDGPVFSRVQVELVMGRRDLSAPRSAIRPKPADYIPPKPADLGSLKGLFDPASPVTQCYEAYCDYFLRTQ